MAPASLASRHQALPPLQSGFTKFKLLLVPPEYAMFSCTCHGYTHPLSSCQMSPLILAPTKHLSPGIPALTPLSQTPSSMHQSSVRRSVPHLNRLLVDVESIFMPSLSVAHTVVKCLLGWMDGWTDGWEDRWMWKDMVVRESLVTGGIESGPGSNWDGHRQKSGRQRRGCHKLSPETGTSQTLVFTRWF